MNDRCEHDWIVFSTCLGTIEIMCECETCGAFGVVPDSTREEWNEAFDAPNHPYRWRGGDDRVIVKKRGPGLTTEAGKHSRESEFKAVIDELADRYPGTVDYQTEDGDVFCLLDKDDKVIATVDEREMTGVWKAVELASPENGE